MKLGEMNLEQQAVVICDLCEPVAVVLEDAKVGEAMGKLAGDPEKGSTLGEMMGRFVRHVVPLMLRNHLNEIVKIVSVLTGKKPEEVRKSGIGGMTRDLIGCFDAELLDFFKSSADTGRTKSQA